MLHHPGPHLPGPGWMKAISRHDFWAPLNGFFFFSNTYYNEMQMVSNKQLNLKKKCSPPLLCYLSCRVFKGLTTEKKGHWKIWLKKWKCGWRFKTREVGGALSSLHGRGVKDGCEHCGKNDKRGTKWRRQSIRRPLDFGEAGGVWWMDASDGTASSRRECLTSLGDVATSCWPVADCVSRHFYPPKCTWAINQTQMCIAQRFLNFSLSLSSSVSQTWG